MLTVNQLNALVRVAKSETTRIEVVGVRQDRTGQYIDITFNDRSGSLPAVLKWDGDAWKVQ